MESIVESILFFIIQHKDVDNTKLDDLTPMDIQTLDEWFAKFEFKYIKLGTLAGWSMAGSPIPTEIMKLVRAAQAQTGLKIESVTANGSAADLEAYNITLYANINIRDA